MFRSRKPVSTQPHIPSGIRRRELRVQLPPEKKRRRRLKDLLAVPLRYGMFFFVLWFGYNMISPGDRVEIAEFLTEKTGYDVVALITPAPVEEAVADETSGDAAGEDAVATTE